MQNLGGISGREYEQSGQQIRARGNCNADLQLQIRSAPDLTITERPNSPPPELLIAKILGYPDDVNPTFVLYRWHKAGKVEVFFHSGIYTPLKYRENAGFLAFARPNCARKHPW